MKNMKIQLSITLIVALVFLGTYAGFVISQPSKNPQTPDSDFIVGLQDFSVSWIGSSNISNSLIDSLDRKLTASGSNKLVILEQTSEAVSGDILFVDGHWFGNSASDTSFMKRFLNSRKPVIIVGGDRAAVSAIILNQLQELLSEGSTKDLDQYSDPLPHEEVVAAVAIWPGKEVTTSQLIMRGWAETDKEALDSLVDNMLQQIANNSSVQAY
ncbi:MAG TPA: hypothetical protein VIH48_02240 [Candidatus Bathyarchaeia archaeon]